MKILDKSLQTCPKGRLQKSGNFFTKSYSRDRDPLPPFVVYTDKYYHFFGVSPLLSYYMERRTDRRTTRSLSVPFFINITILPDLQALHLGGQGNS